MATNGKKLSGFADSNCQSGPQREEGKISNRLERLLLVFITTRESVPKHTHMRPRVSCTSTQVSHVGLRMARHAHTHKPNVGRIQKTSSPGHDLGFKSCP